MQPQGTDSYCIARCCRRCMPHRSVRSQGCGGSPHRCHMPTARTPTGPARLHSRADRAVPVQGENCTRIRDICLSCMVAGRRVAEGGHPTQLAASGGWQGGVGWCQAAKGAGEGAVTSCGRGVVPQVRRELPGV